MATLTLSDRLTGAEKCGSGLTGLNSQAGARLKIMSSSKIPFLELVGGTTKHAGLGYNSHHLPKKTQERSTVFSLYLHNEWLVVTPAPRLNTERASRERGGPMVVAEGTGRRGVLNFYFSWPE
ncbi:unnamed protein product [Pleuronectes platessa]|uniref:Uncharacterized protein n=1 Tax=Pleuronectes platessa TaxID=8262 RepID=A0A9N7VHW9_PLEPL|nr:unnamed protein product [Pleuronectes platessa]